MKLIKKNHLQSVAFYLAVLVPFFAYISPAIIDLLVVLVSLLFITNSIINKDYTWLGSKWIKYASLFWLYIIINSLFNDPLYSLGRSLSFIRFILFAAALESWLLNDDRSYNIFKKSIIYSLIFAVTDSYIQYLFGKDLLGNYKLDDRLTGPMTRPRVGIIISWYMAPVMLFFFEKSKDRLPYLLLCPYIILLIFLSGDRMAFLLSILFFGIIFFLKRYRLLVISIGLTLIMGIALIFSYDQSIFKRQYSSHNIIKDLGNSVYGRIMESGINIFKDHPITGVGTKNFRKYCPKEEYSRVGEINSPSKRCNLHPHNNYIEILSENGIIGLALLLMIFWQWVKLFNRRISLFGLGAFIAIFIRMWPIASTGSFFVSWSAAPLWIMAGVYLASIKKGR